MEKIFDFIELMKLIAYQKLFYKNNSEIFCWDDFNIQFIV